MAQGKLRFCVTLHSICDMKAETASCCQEKKKPKLHYYLSAGEFVHACALGVWLFLIAALMLSLPVCQVWSLAMVATDLCLGPKSDPDLEIPWAQHPFGRQLLESL